jgi:hypothetical protein
VQGSINLRVEKSFSRKSSMPNTFYRELNVVSKELYLGYQRTALHNNFSEAKELCTLNLPRPLTSFIWYVRSFFNRKKMDTTFRIYSHQQPESRFLGSSTFSSDQKLSNDLVLSQAVPPEQSVISVSIPVRVRLVDVAAQSVPSLLSIKFPFGLVFRTFYRGLDPQCIHTRCWRR